MGNRCFIVSKDYNKEQIHCYLQWEGGLRSILGFLQGAKELLALESQDTFRFRIRYDLFSFATCIANYCQTCGYNTYIGHSNNINQLETDNGVYTIDFDTLQIVDWSEKTEGQDLTISPDKEYTDMVTKRFYDINYKVLTEKTN